MFGRIPWPSEAGAAILLRQDKDLTVPWPLPCTPAQRRCGRDCGRVRQGTLQCRCGWQSRLGL